MPAKSSSSHSRLAFLKSGKLWLGLLVVAGLLAAALWPQTVEVDLATVSRGQLMVTIDEEGESRLRQRYQVTAPVAGEVMRIELEPGDKVEANRTRLALIQPAAPVPLDARTRAEREAAAQAAEAELHRAMRQRDQAQTIAQRAQQQYRRLARLLEAGSIAPDRVDDSKAEADAAREAWQAAQSAVNQARYRQAAAQALLMTGAPDPVTGAVTVMAPVDGVVLKRHHESRAVVAAGEPLLEVGDISRLEIVSDLLSSEAVKVSPGDRVLIEYWGGDQTLNGRVRRVEPGGFLKVSALGVEEQRVNVIIDFTDPRQSWAALGDGYRVEVRIVVWQEDDVLKVPVGSLFRVGQDWAVYRAQGDAAHLARVSLGRRNSQEAQVLKGLSQGDQVVLYPPDDLKDQTPIAQRSP